MGGLDLGGLELESFNKESDRRSSSMIETSEHREAKQSAELFDLGEARPCLCTVFTFDQLLILCVF